MAIITTSNANRIIFNTDLQSLNLAGDVYKTPIDFLNQLETKRFLALKELFADAEKFLSEFFKPIKKNDTLSFVYEGAAPAYHKSIDCERLGADYENFIIPTSIKEQGKAKVDDFRKWFKENKHLLAKPEVFVARLQMKWGVITNPENIVRGNSGFIEFEDFTPIKLEEQIDLIINKAIAMCDENNAILDKYKKHSYLGERKEPLKENDTGFSDIEVKAVLKKFEAEIKKPLTPLLTSYYRATLNPNLNLQTSVLKQLGFTPCNNCYSLEEKIHIEVKENFELLNKKGLSTLKEEMRVLDERKKLIETELRRLQLKSSKKSD